MAIKISFRLKDPQLGIRPSKQKETLVFMFVNFGYFQISPSGGKKYVPLKYSSGEMILPRFWNKEDQCARQVSDFEYEGFNRRLEDIENCAKKAHRDILNEGIIPTPDILKKRIDESLKGKEEVTHYNLNAFIDKFIKEISNGKRTTQNGGRYKPLTTKNIKGFQSQFNEFQVEIGKSYNYADITMDFYEDFIQFFNNKNYSPNTIGRHIKILKTIMRIAREEGLHSNMEIERRKFKSIRVEVDSVYLTEKELNAMLNLNLSKRPTLDLARDVFLIGCYTAQRYSDYSRIRKENIRTTDRGAKVIDLIQQKTGERVIIPIKPELDAILKKYEYTIPKSYEQKVNSRIKDVAEEAGITDLVPTESIRGGVTVKKDVPKCDLIKTHTARRSGCTNMYLAGIPTLDIMKISGHKTEREFLKYIKVGKEETADNLATHSYFNNPLRIAE